jgi:adenylate cyclase
MKPRARTLSLLAVAVVAATVGVVLLATDALRGPEHTTADWRYDLRGAQAPRDDVVVVALDDATIDGIGEFPFDRRHHARVIDSLAAAGAAVIAYDVQFTQQSRNADADTALINAVRSAAPRVILATTAVDPGGKTQIFGGAAGLEYSRGTPGFSGYLRDGDGVTRHLPAASVEGLRHFAYAAAQRKSGAEITPPPRDETWIDYPDKLFRQLSFQDVESGNFDASDVRGKVVVVGATASVLNGFFRSPTNDRLPSAQLQAATIATALDDFPLRDAPAWLDVLLIVALASVAPLVALRFGALVAVGAAVIATALFLVAAQLVFNGGTVLTILPAVVAAGVGALGTFLVRGAHKAHPRLNRWLDRLSPGGGFNRRTRRLRTALLLGAGLFCAVGGLGLMALDGLRRLDLASVDMRFDVRGAREAPDSVVLVAIDDATINSPGLRFPFSRKYHARAIRNLAKAGAGVIAYDVQFTQESRDVDADTALIEAVRAAAPRVVMAATAVERGETNVFGGGAGLRYSRAAVGESNFEADADGVTRHMSTRADGLDTLPVVTAEKKLGRPVAASGTGDQWIDYAGPPRTVKYLSFVDVVRDRFKASDVKDKVVVVGGTATALQDQRETATTDALQMPGPEVHANAITTALAGFPLHSDVGWVNALLVILLATAAPFAAVRLRMLFAIAIGVLALAALVVGAQVAFNNDVIITVVYALVAGVAALLLTSAIHGVTVAFERANTRDAFARFVPESVVDQVLQDAEGVRLGGVRGEATVMFSDLRGFTSFAETLEPEQVIDALNRYLTAMSEAILDHGGTLVAYMGDGIMAVFGAPLHQDDHADRALAAARDMLARLEDFNGWLREQELHQGFKMGIGLNSGPVMSGNVGSERRLEYTALGDTTNTAARLEGMTKGTPHQLYIADSTYTSLTTPADDLVEVGEFEVRGRKAKIKLWSLTDEEPAPPPAKDAEADETPAPASVSDDQ